MQASPYNFRTFLSPQRKPGTHVQGIPSRPHPLAWGRFLSDTGLQLGEAPALLEASVVSVPFSEALYTVVPCSFGPTSTESGLTPVWRLQRAVGHRDSRLAAPRCVLGLSHPRAVPASSSEVAAAPE